MPPSFTGHKTETFTVANNLATNVAALVPTSGVDITNATARTGTAGVLTGLLVNEWSRTGTDTQCATSLVLAISLVPGFAGNACTIATNNGGRLAITSDSSGRFARGASTTYTY
jgi:hypothetical protein